MRKIFFVMVASALLLHSIVLAQANNTVQEFVMLDGKILAFERVTTKEGTITPLDTSKELEEMLSHQKTIIMNMIQKGMPDQTNKDYVKNEIARLVWEISQHDADRRISLSSSNTALVRQISTERKALE
jgi:gas vesicle protein